MDINKLTAMFVSPQERPVAVLGNNIAENFFSTGTIGNGFAILSDKRVYFRGRCLVHTGKRFSSRMEERVVDAQDITGTGFICKNPVWLLILGYVFSLAVLFFLLMGVSLLNDEWIFVGGPFLLAITCFVLYRAKKCTLFEISYAGGGIAFNVSWFPAQEAQIFQKQLKLVSDAAKKQATPGSTPRSAADELNKLAQLLAQGLITQAEFDAQKQSLLYH